MGYKNVLYVTVKSTDSRNYYPENNATNFYTKLPYTLELEGDWTVGINQIWIKKMWYNISDVYIQITKNDGENILNRPVEIISIEDGYYHDMDTLLKELNSKCTVNGENLCVFKFNDINGKATIETLTGYTMVMSKKLTLMLGMSDHFFTGEITGNNCADLHYFDGLVYVHSDIATGFMYSNTGPDVVKTFSTDRYKFGQIIHESGMNDKTRVFCKRMDTVHVYVSNKNGIIKQGGGETIIQFKFSRE